MQIAILESIENVFNMDIIFMEYGFPMHFFLSYSYLILNSFYILTFEIRIIVKICVKKHFSLPLNSFRERWV